MLACAKDWGPSCFPIIPSHVDRGRCRWCSASESPPRRNRKDFADDQKVCLARQVQLVRDINGLRRLFPIDKSRLGTRHSLATSHSVKRPGPTSASAYVVQVEVSYPLKNVTDSRRIARIGLAFWRR